MSKTFVMGDIHGAHKALRQCLERSNFNNQYDKLIFLGDISDGWPETKACIDELLLIKNLIVILGNHDFWTLDWMKTGTQEDIWLDQGGRATVESYKDGIPTQHISFLENALPYYLDDNKFFVHAGFNPLTPIETQTLQTFLWDRNLARIALSLYNNTAPGKLTAFDEVYLGHTPIPYKHPICSNEIWLMDTGAGWSGVLSIMDIHSKEFFTSDPVPTLYPGVEGRSRR